MNINKKHIDKTQKQDSYLTATIDNNKVLMKDNKTIP